MLLRVAVLQAVILIKEVQLLQQEIVLLIRELAHQVEEFQLLQEVLQQIEVRQYRLQAEVHQAQAVLL
jgi:butyrate kinase